MNELPEFIAELVRAANEVPKLSEFTRARLLDRAYNTIRDCREKIGVAQDSLDRDPAIDFLTMSRSIPAFTDDEIKTALLEAAGLLRDLHIIIDTKIDVLLNNPDDQQT